MMHSNFITPPDLVETILIVDATEDEIKECADICRDSSVVYNVYFYQNHMNDINWLVSAYNKADTVLQASGSTVPVLKPIKFGIEYDLKRPGDYFNK
jgi:hypothetical protein